MIGTLAYVEHPHLGTANEINRILARHVDVTAYLARSFEIEEAGVSGVVRFSIPYDPVEALSHWPRSFNRGYTRRALSSKIFARVPSSSANAST